jgi:Domain of unknown function (DUF4382)
MFRFRSILTIFALGICAVFAGCRGNTQFGSQNQSGNSSVVLAVTDTPPSNVSILSAQVTLTGVTLAPGNVPIFSDSTTIELTRLQTDIAYLAKANNVPAGSYTGVMLTFANPTLTIENDTTSVIGGCAIGSICTIHAASTNLSTTVSLSSFSIVANSTNGLLIDVNLDTLLSATLAADFKNGVAVSSFTPAGAGAPLVGAEDVVGQVASPDATHNTFTFQNATGSFSLLVDNSTTFFQFPQSACTASGFACLHANQVLSVDIGIKADGTLVARNILFEDSDNTAEVEGMITSTNVGSLEFNMVVLGNSSTTTGPTTGNQVTVQYSVAPQTPFDIDFAHADNVPVSTTGFIFAAPVDLAVGQQVSVRRNTSSTASLIKADRVRLRSTRVTANVQSIGAPNINLGTIPSIFSAHGVTQIQALTSAETIFSENSSAIVITQIPVSGVVSVRGPLFNVSGTRTLVAGKVVLKP